MAVDGEVGGNLLRGECVFGSVVDDLVGIRLFSFLFPREDSAIEIQRETIMEGVSFPCLTQGLDALWSINAFCYPASVVG